MKKKITKFYYKSATIFMAAVIMGCVSGCGAKELTLEQQDMVAEYAAQMVLKHDANYTGKVIEKITEEETTTQKVSNGADSNDETVASTQTEGETKENVTYDAGDVNNHSGDSFATAFGMSPADISYTGYSVQKKYPEGDDVFALNAVDGTSLLIMKFTLTNTTTDSIDIPMMTSATSIKAVINDEKKYSAMLTLLLDGLNTYKGTLAPGQSQNLVLVFQTPYMNAEDISNLSLAVSYNGKSTNFSLK